MDSNTIARKWIQGMTVKPDSLLGQTFTGEEGAHVFRITGETTGGAAAPITGTIAAKFLRSDNITVPLSGSVSDGVAVVTLTDECYLVPGRFIFSIYVIQGDLRMCIYCGVGNVFRTDSGEYEGGQIITDITELINEIQEAVESIPPDYSELTGEVADLKSAVESKPDIRTPQETDSDLYICDDNGNVIAEFKNGHVETKNFKSDQAGQIVAPIETGADLYVCDDNGNVIAEFKNGHIKTKNFDSSQAHKTGIIGRNEDVTDGVYASCRWHQPFSSAKQFCLLMGTDFHADSARLKSMVEYLNAVDAFDAGICLGDIAGNTWQDSATYYTTAISNTTKPFLTVIGNHDAGYGNTITTSYTNIADLVAKFITPNIQYADLTSGEYPSGKSYYYKDFSAYGIRLIVLNNYEYPPDNDGTNFTYIRGYNCWSQDQISWLVSTLNSTPSTYGVIIATHFAPSTIAVDKTSEWTSSTMAYSSYGVNTMMRNDGTDDRTILSDIVNAWINGTTLSRTYQFSVVGTWTSLVVNADFSSRGAGEFITWIGGHLHMSVKGSVYAHQDQNVYLVDCSSIAASTQGDTPRKEGTRSEDAICVLSVDRDLKKVKLLRIGAHFTKDAVNRLYGSYSYIAE